MGLSKYLFVSKYLLETCGYEFQVNPISTVLCFFPLSALNRCYFCCILKDIGGLNQNWVLIGKGILTMTKFNELKSPFLGSRLKK